VSGSGPTPAEQHLGDRLAALVDGELGHDERERVLSHLATCPRCKAEAACQRRLKSVFAEVAPPPPSEGFLARLQGLPGGLPGGDDDDDEGRGPFGFGRAGFSIHGTEARGPGSGGFSYAPAGAPTGVFPVHQVDRQDGERSLWRGRRFAFAAASAVSLAAMALGGAIPSSTSADAPLGRDAGNNVVPVRAPGTSTAGETGRRQGRSARGGSRQSAVPGTLQVRNLSAHVFATPSFALPVSPSLPVLPLTGTGFPAGTLNSAIGAPLVGPTGIALRSAAPDAAPAVAPSAVPSPGPFAVPPLPNATH
jgi:Putative zinc-finger